MAENELTNEECLRLQRYLPSSLYDLLVAEKDDPSGRLRSRVITHLSALLEATTTHLPASLVKQLQENPVPGLAQGRFVEGTLLFADISGFTAMSEKLSQSGREGAEEVTAVVNRYFDQMLAILKDYKGDLIRFGGDALLGLFEEGRGPYSSATQAVQAAMKMQAGMSQFAQTKTSQGTFPLRMSVGVHKGRFFAAQLGTEETMEYALFGSEVNNTAAIESAANAGQVLLDKLTYDEIDDSLLCTAVAVPEHPDYLAVEHIDLPPLPPAYPPMETHYPLAPTLARIWRIVKQLDVFTPYLPAGLLARLASDPIATSLKGEHRPVANIFANVDGLGDIADRLGPGAEEQIIAALNLYFTRISDALYQFGGVVNKIDLYDHGEKLMVIFGAPVAHEDDVERAVRASLAMQSVFDEIAIVLPQQTGLPDLNMQQRIGISAGYVFAGYVGSSWRHEYTVMGDEVNLAARLMSTAVPGSIIISENVKRRVSEVAEFEQRGEVQLKGKSQPVPIFEVKKVQDRRDLTYSIQGMQSELVGREEEWQQLSHDIDQLRHGHGRIISIIGEAGVGKSRLVRDLQQAETDAPNSSTAVRWVTGRCLSYTESVSYTPFQEITHNLVSVTTDENVDNARQQLQSSLSNWLTENEIEANLPFIANFLNIPLTDAQREKVRYLDGEALQRSTFVAFRVLIEAQAKKQPLIIYIDDIQWMDHASLDLLEYLMPLVEQIPLMFLWLFRPEREKGAWELRRKARQELTDHYDEIGLYGLSTTGAQEMLLNLVPVETWPEGVAELILNRVEGNPLYLEEVIRSLMNDGLLVQREDGRWQFSDTITSITVPDTLEGVLLARLDRLEELCRFTVQVASVVGRSFPYDVLTHTAETIYNLPVNEYLSELQIVEIIREAQRNPEVVYAFIHSLMQEVSYGTLAASARREYHRLIAQYLEDSRTHGWGRTESLLPLIAHHAYEGSDWPRALKYQMKAGQQAQQLFANQEALDHYRKALHCAEQQSLTETAVQRLAIHLALGQILVETGQYDGALVHLAEADKLAQYLEDEAAETAVCRWYARLYEVKSEYDTAREWVEKGLALESQKLSANYAQILMAAGLINIRQGRFDQALQYCQDVLAIGEQLDEVAVLARAYSLLGFIYLRSDSNKAIEQFQKSFDLYNQAGHIQGQALAHNLIANACFNLGRWAEAETHYLQAYQLFDQIGNKYNLAMAANNLGGIALKRGQYDAALMFYDEGLRSAEKIGGSAWMLGTFHMNLGWTYVYQNDVLQARTHLANSKRYFEEGKTREFMPELLRHQAEASLIAEEFAMAETQISESLSLARELKMRNEEGMSFRIAGRIALSQSKVEEAIMVLKRSVSILSEAEEEYELALSHYWLAVVLFETNDVQAARPLLSQAEETFHRLEAEHDLTAVQNLQTQLNVN